MKRTGLIAKKVGTSYVYENDSQVCVTLLEIKENVVTDVKTIEKNGYTAVQIGAFDSKPKHTTKPLRGHFAKAKVSPKKKVKEFRVSNDALINVGTELSVDHFVKGQYVDVSSVSVGKGFAGVMKRHNFGGLRASHGVSISHRSHGSTGQCQDPGRVAKGKKMAGQMGNVKTTCHNLKVISVDNELGLIIISGSVPGKTGAYVFVKDSVKKALPINAPYPTVLKVNNSEDNTGDSASTNNVSSSTEKVNNA